MTVDLSVLIWTDTVVQEPAHQRRVLHELCCRFNRHFGLLQLRMGDAPVAGFRRETQTLSSISRSWSIRVSDHMPWSWRARAKVCR